MNKLFYSFIIIFSLFSLILPSFSFIQAVNQSPKANQPPKMPETLDEILLMGKRALNIFPTAIKGAWQEALKIWQKMADFFRNLWDSYIFSKIEGIWQKILSLFGKEVEKKKEIIPQELEKEKRELLK